LATLWGVAVAGLGEALGGNLEPLSGEGSDRSLANITRHTATGAASLFASAATRSALEGSSFGPNIRAGLPDVIGQALGRAIGGAARQALTAPAEQATATPGVRMTIGEQLSGAIVNLSSAGYIGDAGLDALLAPVLPLGDGLAVGTTLLEAREAAKLDIILAEHARRGGPFGNGAASDAPYIESERVNRRTVIDDWAVTPFEHRGHLANFAALVRGFGDNITPAEQMDLDRIAVSLKAEGDYVRELDAHAEQVVLATGRAIGGIWVDVAGTVITPIGVADSLVAYSNGQISAAELTIGLLPGSKLLKSGRAVEAAVINPRLTTRLTKWRDYQAAGGQLEMQGWIQATQGQSWGLGGRRGYADWIRSVESTHGNSLLSGRSANLYELYTKDGRFLKYGVSQNPYSRYSSSFMADKDIFPIASGTRREMIVLERQKVTLNPGPLNLEPWAQAARAVGRGQ